MLVQLSLGKKSLVSFKTTWGITTNFWVIDSLEMYLFSFFFSFLKLPSVPCCIDQSVYEGLFLSEKALRNREIDEHLSMTPINLQHKSSVSLCAMCYSMGDRQSPCMQTMSPICQGHNNSPGRPICITVWTTNVIDQNIDYFVFRKEMSLVSFLGSWIIASLNLSYVTFLKMYKVFFF